MTLEQLNWKITFLQNCSVLAAVTAVGYHFLRKVMSSVRKIRLYLRTDPRRSSKRRLPVMLLVMSLFLAPFCLGPAGCHEDWKVQQVHSDCDRGNADSATLANEPEASSTPVLVRQLPPPDPIIKPNVETPQVVRCGRHSSLSVHDVQCASAGLSDGWDNPDRDSERSACWPGPQILPVSYRNLPLII